MATHCLFEAEVFLGSTRTQDSLKVTRPKNVDHVVSHVLKGDHVGGTWFFSPQFSMAPVEKSAMAMQSYLGRG